MPSDPLSWIDGELVKLDAAALRRTLIERRAPQGESIELAGAKLVNFGSNDYLGLAADPRLKRAALECAPGWGAGASPLVSGRGAEHAALERELAEFEGCEAALLFPSGFAANAGAIPALVGAGDAIFSDQFNHASIIDGCRLSGAKVAIYRHADLDHLRELLENGASYRRKLVVSDSLFSMDGDLAPLVGLAQLAEEHGAMLMIDEAHATGVFGASGRGAAEELGVEEGVHIRVGTLSKALGSAGGVVAGSRALIDWLANRARSYVFSTAGPEAAAAAARIALDIVRSEPERRVELLSRAAHLRDRLLADGWKLGPTQSQIIPVLVGESEAALALGRAMREAGFFTPAIRPPSVPAGGSRLRLSLSYGHSAETIDSLVEAMRRVRAASAWKG